MTVMTMQSHKGFFLLFKREKIKRKVYKNPGEARQWSAVELQPERNDLLCLSINTRC